MTSSEEASSAAFDLAWYDTGVGLQARFDATRELENTGAKKLTADEANKLYPDMIEPFREDVNPYVANMRHNQQMEKMQLQSKMANGPTDWWTKTKMFGAGLVAHMMDPWEFGVGAVGGWAVGGVASKGLLGARASVLAGRVASGTAATGERIAYNIAEAGAGATFENATQEFAIQAQQAYEGTPEERTNRQILDDFMFNTFAATVFGAGIKEASFQGMKRVLRSTSPEADLLHARTVVSAVDTEVAPDIRPLVKTLASETDVNPVHFGKEGYTYTPRAAGDGKIFYAATKGLTGLDGERLHLGDDLGLGGTHLTDNPGVANAAASRAMSDSKGAVHQVDMGDLNPLHLNQPLPENISPKIKELLDKMGFEDSANTIKTESAADVLGFIRNASDEGLLPEGALDNVKQAIKEGGYDSLISDGGSRAGSPHSQHNHITVLDDGKVVAKQSFEADPLVKNQPDKNDVEYASQTNDDAYRRLFADKENVAKNRERITEVQAAEKTDIRKNIDSLNEEIKSYVDQGLMDEGDLKVLEEVRDTLSLAEDQHTLLKAFKACASL